MLIPVFMKNLSVGSKVIVRREGDRHMDIMGSYKIRTTSKSSLLDTFVMYIYLLQHLMPQS
jgi:hypothetical protein